MMDIIEIYEKLCWYDNRNPYFIPKDEDEEARKPRVNCSCDNCFYGRDKLAMEILRLLGK